jgi:hypothetical protein
MPKGGHPWSARKCGASWAETWPLTLRGSDQLPPPNWDFNGFHHFKNGTMCKFDQICINSQMYNGVHISPCVCVCARARMQDVLREANEFRVSRSAPPCDGLRCQRMSTVSCALGSHPHWPILGADVPYAAQLHPSSHCLHIPIYAGGWYSSFPRVENDPIVGQVSHGVLASDILEFRLILAGWTSCGLGSHQACSLWLVHRFS